MTRRWLDDLQAMVAAEGQVVRVSIVRADGSAPQGVGSAMTVGREMFSGTVGGGALELEALREARSLLDNLDRHDAALWRRRLRDFPLGPALGQCCGGYVQLLFETVGEPECASLPAETDSDTVLVRPVSSGSPWVFVQHRKDDEASWPLPVRGRVRELLSGARGREAALMDGWYVEPIADPAQPLFLYGAGHVGRALVNVLKDLPFEIYWVDTAPERYPDHVPDGIHKLASADPATAADHAPAGAWHLVMTYSHAIDFEVCRTVLARGAYGYVGVIASKTKRARFLKRLGEAGIRADRLRDLHAPIGLAGLEGKEPATIAVSVAADFLLRLQQGSAREQLPRTDNARGGS